jgi:hypothetical protein
MGLVDTADRPYEEVTEVFRRLNPVLETYHREGRSPEGPLAGSAASIQPVRSSTGLQNPTPLPRAVRPLDVTDQSLVDWDKSRTRLTDLQTVDPYVPFGDIHLAWKPEGLYVASIANTYVDPRLLDYQGDFPLSEAFQLHVQVEAAGRLHEFVIYLVPQANSALPDGFEIIPKLYRKTENSAMELMPNDGHLQRIHKSLPHMLLEAFLPAEWLGVPELKEGMPLRMNLILVSFYREMTMSWTGAPRLGEGGGSEGLRAVILRDTQEGLRAESPSGSVVP